VQAVVLPAEHWPHQPPGWHAGADAEQSASEAHARQTCVAVLHTGVAPPHCAFEVQGTQVPEGTSQAAVAPVHRLAFVTEHWPQAPLAWQAGVEPPHSASPPQARQVWVAPSQTGAVPVHWAFDVHDTHTPVGVWQSGVVPVQAAALVAEHWPQAPLGWQAGVAPPHSPSPAQPRH
jgi:hypothetical protein